MIRAICVASMIFAAFPALAAHELTDRDLTNGRALYAENCASCHGVELEGQPDWRRPGADGVLPAPPHDETGHTWHHDNRLLFDYTRLGGQVALEERGIAGFKSGMPGYGDVLSDEDIWDILGFIRSTWPERVQEMQAARNNPNH